MQTIEIKEIKKLILKIDTGLHILDDIFKKHQIKNPIEIILYDSNKKIVNEAIVNLILCIMENKKIIETNDKDIIKLVDMCKKYTK